jgi:predicted MPP superfamily phosphohydrolase
MFLIPLCLLILLFYMLYQATTLKIEHLAVNNGNLNIRIALISDIHSGLLMVDPKHVFNALKEYKPDLLIIAGDMIDKDKDMNIFTKWINQVSPPCPVFAVLGNHDHKCFIKQPKIRDVFFFNLKSLGIEVLINSSVTFHKEGKIINIAGIDDLKQGSPNINLALSSLDENADFTVAIAHNPDIVLDIPSGKVDLFLCGHFHGGQIWMPFNIEYKLLRKEKTCREGYRKGLCDINGTLTYISRGIGNVVAPLRLGSLPEIAFIDL